MNRKNTSILAVFAIMLTVGLILVSLPAQAHAGKVTATPSPSPTATTTALPGLQLPAWMRDPKAMIVTLQTEGGAVHNSFEFLNVGTGEHFDLNLPYVEEVRWVTALDGVYLELIRDRAEGYNSSNGFLETVKLDTGTLVRYDDLDDPRIPHNPLSVIPPVDNGHGVSYQMVAQAEWVGSKGNYQLLTRKGILLTNAKTGKSTILYGDITDQEGDAELLSVSAQWFAGGRFLGVSKTRNDGIVPDPIYDDGHGLSNDVYIWDANGKYQAGFEDAIQARFSMAHTMILYRDISKDDSNSESDSEDSSRHSKVCVSDISKGENSQALADCTLLGKLYATIGSYEWSPDGQKIIYTYSDYNANDTTSISGGLCIVDLKSRKTDCPITRTVKTGSYSGYYSYQPGDLYGIFAYKNFDPPGKFDSNVPGETGLCLINQQNYGVNCITDKLLPTNTYFNLAIPSRSGNMVAITYIAQKDESQQGVCLINLQNGSAYCPNISPSSGYIEDMSWSPDNRYLLFMQSSGPYSDDKTFTQYGVINVAAGTYRDAGGAYWEDSLDRLWRPALNH